MKISCTCILVIFSVLLVAESIPLHTRDELLKLWKKVEKANSQPVDGPVPMDPIPDHVDWREKGVIPAVSNQGQMGQAEVFAVVHAIEAYWAIHHGQLVYGSITEVINCCTTVHIVTVEELYSCIIRIGGLATDDDYPRNVSGKCLSQMHKPAIFINGHREVDHFDEKALAAAVAITPVVVLVDASKLELYKSGVFSDHGCSTTKLDHAMLVVGYGTMDGKDYWLCQNSWGSEWGMDGYIMIARNAGNMCGIATKASYPV